MRELIKYIKDVRFYVPVIFFILFELFLQSGYYSHFMQRSYAYNIDRIVNNVNKSDIKPDILILGTSVAYQGINVRLLNNILKPHKIRVLSGACEGAKLLTQHLIYKAVKKKLTNLRTIIHVSEVSFPWTARFEIDPPNRSMIAQIPRQFSLPLLDRYRVQLGLFGRLYLYVRIITFQKDLRNAVMGPLERIKLIGRRLKKRHRDFAYENKHSFRLSAYGAKNLHDCIKSASHGIPETNSFGKPVTDRHHRNAVLQTCRIGLKDPMRSPGASQWNKLFFERLRLFYNELDKDGLQIITVFAPYSDLIHDLNAAKRIHIWEKNLAKFNYRHQVRILDLRKSLDAPDNGQFYYDTIHLNRYGALIFTQVLAKHIIKMVK